MYNFNPRSREGSDTFPRYINNSHTVISIHAPAKGATSYQLYQREYKMISIHAPAKGATWYKKPTLQIKVISIHAPAKGATLLGYAVCTLHHYFNPRSREGSDPSSPLALYLRMEFQSTLPRRERLIDPKTGKKVDKFQSTLPRRERRSANAILFLIYNISIHAPAKGATN